MEKNEIGGACSADGRGERYVQCVDEETLGKETTEETKV
jgi:hypothetical protein